MRKLIGLGAKVGLKPAEVRAMSLNDFAAFCRGLGDDGGTLQPMTVDEFDSLRERYGR